MINKEHLEIYGDASLYSVGTSTVMADEQIKRGIEKGVVTSFRIEGNRRVICFKPTGKWFIHSGGYGNNEIKTWMLGAVAGDIAGSIYELHNIKEKIDESRLVSPYCTFTDDTVMTCAVAKGIMDGIKNFNDDWYKYGASKREVRESIRQSLSDFGNMYPDAGYGKSFKEWLVSDEKTPYSSWGNGSAMRVSFAGWVAKTLEEAETLAELSAEVTHNHPEGIKGAKAVAGSVFTLKMGGTKEDVKNYVSKYYKLDFTLNEIRQSYNFDVSCQGSVPQAVEAFLESRSFSETLINAISIGGDSDTIAAIAGSIAEVIYPISQELRGRVIDHLDDFLKNVIIEADDFIFNRFVSSE